MKITAKFFNTLSVQEKSTISPMAQIYKGEDITFAKMYIYFFNRYGPLEFDTFNRFTRKMLRSFGLSTDRVQMITWNFLPSRANIQSVINRFSPGEDVATICMLSMYMPMKHILEIGHSNPEKNVELLYSIKVPEFLKRLYSLHRDTFFDKYRYMCDKMYQVYAISAIVEEYCGISINAFRILYTKFFKTKAILINQTTYRFATWRHL